MDLKSDNKVPFSILSKEQETQESYYDLPYHYITQFKTNFQSFYYDYWGISYASTIEFLLEKISMNDFHRIIDIGCGDGRFTRELAQVFPNRYIEGIDYSPHAISIAKSLNPKLLFSVKDVITWKPEVKFDCAVLMEVFEHIPLNESRDFVKGVADIICPGGTLFVTVPHKNVPLSAHHFRHFDVASLHKLWEFYFDIDEIFGFERKGITRSFFLHCLRNRFFILSNYRLLNSLYYFYKKYLFSVKFERQAQRIFMRAIKKA